MNIANNQRHKETESRLRNALLTLMEEGREPTVGRLCEMAEINRSTFYRHYTDVPDLMEKTEQEIQKGLFHSVSGQNGFLEGIGKSSEALVPLIAYIGENRNFYRGYLKGRIGLPMGKSFQQFWDVQAVPIFRSHGIESEAHMRYYFEYFKAGFMMVLRRWLENDCPETPEEMAEIVYKMFPSRPQ